jgi:hypothetical protein
MGARWYDPSIGLWTQPDPIVPNLMDPLSLNRYAFVEGNPLTNRDPSGHYLTSGDEGLPGGSGDVSAADTITLADAIVQTEESVVQSVEATAEQQIVQPLQQEEQQVDATVQQVVSGSSPVTQPVLPGLEDLASPRDFGGDTSQKMAQVRSVGDAGETSANISKNTEHIRAASGAANYRVPDELSEYSRAIGEVKNVKYQHYSSQLKDYVAFAKANGYTFKLTVRVGTQISLQLQMAVDQGDIILDRSLP